jgi:hypothetical protein
MFLEGVRMRCGNGVSRTVINEVGFCSYCTFRSILTMSWLGSACSCSSMVSKVS